MTVQQRRTRASLTEEAIVDAAIALCEREGAEALTFRRLGAELGAAPTAVLRHFRDKDDLLIGMGDRLLAEALDALDLPLTASTSDWRERIRAIARATRGSFLAHPRVAVLVASRTLQRETEFRAANAVIQALLDAGLRGREAASVYRAVVDTVLAMVGFEAATRTYSADELARDRRAWVVHYPSLPEAAYPAIHEVAEHLAEVDEEDQFEVTLDLLLEAVALRSTRPR